MKNARSISMSPDPNALPDWPGKLDARGKFFFSGDDKLSSGRHLRAVRADARHAVSRRRRSSATLDLMAELGANTLRTFTVPPRWLLDRAASHGIRVLVGIPWAEHVCFLDRREVDGRDPRDGARTRCETCASHPALFGLLVGNEIPPDIVRWYGAGARRGVSSRARAREVKAIAPRPLVSYANFPSTEYLEAEFARLRLLQRLPAPRGRTSAATSAGCRTSRATSRSS